MMFTLSRVAKSLRPRLKYLESLKTGVPYDYTTAIRHCYGKSVLNPRYHYSIHLTISELPHCYQIAIAANRGVFPLTTVAKTLRLNPSKKASSKVDHNIGGSFGSGDNR